MPYIHSKARHLRTSLFDQACRTPGLETQCSQHTCMQMKTIRLRECRGVYPLQCRHFWPRPLGIRSLPLPLRSQDARNPAAQTQGTSSQPTSAHEHTVAGESDPSVTQNAAQAKGSVSPEPVPLVSASVLESVDQTARNSMDRQRSWSAVHAAELPESPDEPIVETYILVDGMRATMSPEPDQRPPKQHQNGHHKQQHSDAPPPDMPTPPGDGKQSPKETYAIILVKNTKSNKSRSAGSKKLLKMLVKASTKFVDTVYALPTMLVSNSHVFLALLAVGWYILGAGLMGSAANKLSTYSPETLQPPGFEVIAAMSSLAQSLSDTLMERIAYIFQNFSYAGILIKIPMVLLAAVPLVLTLGFIYHKATGVPMEQALLKIHSVVHRQPGANMVSEKTVTGWALINLSFFIGMFLVAVLFGLVSDEVKRSFRSIRDGGSFAMRTTGHILILNYNQHMIPLLRQLHSGWKYSDEPFFGRPVVILADKNKYEMDEEIAARLKIQSLDLYTRSGNPATTRDLAMVSAGRADTVIVLHPDSTSNQEVAEACKAAVAMALTVASKGQKQNVVMQMPNELPGTYDFMRSFSKTVQAAKPTVGATGASSGMIGLGQQAGEDNAANVQVLQMPDGNFMDRFTCHAAMQPGVFRVWLKILQQGPATVKLRVKPLPAVLQGKTFADVRRSFRDCVVVGYMRGTEAVFDPAETQALLPTDKLVVLSYVSNPAPRPETASVYRAAAKAGSERIARQSSYTVPPRKVIVAGWDHSELPDMLECFADASPENSQVTFILEKIPEDPSPPSRVGSVRFNYIQSDHPTCLKALNDAGIKTADAVLLGIHEELPPVEADALVLASLLQVQDAVLSSGRTHAPHVVAKVQRFGTTQVISQYFESLNEAAESARGALCATEKALAASGTATAATAAQAKKPAPVKYQVRNSFENFFIVPKDVQAKAAEIKEQVAQAAAAQAQAQALAQAHAQLAAATAAASKAAAAAAAAVPAHAHPAAASCAAKATAADSKVDSHTAGSSHTSGVSGKEGSDDRQKRMDNLMSNWTATFALAGHPPADTPAAAEDPKTSAAAAMAAKAAAAAAGAAAAAEAKVAAAAAAAAEAAKLAEAKATAVASQAGAAAAGITNPLSLAVSAFASKSAATADAASTATSSNTSAAATASSSTASSHQQPQSASSTASTSATSTTTATAPSSTNTQPSTSSHSTAAPTAQAPSTSSSHGSSQGSAGGSTGTSGSSASSSSSSSSTASTARKPAAVCPPLIRNPEIFLSDDISAALLTLVAAHPDVTVLMRQLLTTRQGAELYLRAPSLFNLTLGETVTFAEVAEIARILKQTALGYLKVDGTILLVPEPEHVFTYQEGDQIIVFSDDFKIKRNSGGGMWGR